MHYRRRDDTGQKVAIVMISVGSIVGLGGLGAWHLQHIGKWQDAVEKKLDLLERNQHKLAEAIRERQ